MSYSKATRHKNLVRLPWITRLKKPVPCDGIKWSKVALKHIFVMGGKDPEGIPDRAKCKNMAQWRFRSLKKSWARDGNYCTTHLNTNLWDEDERQRYTRWFDKNGWEE